ncbi:MOSC domain-containing protein [Sulfitobacter sp. D35]|uniref:MOSC domain-containing protein n=1 Tax=Sulfitobacter sp. D35 TaxID=3083252 RepID=UPI00296F13F7|nr:MOSC N-terminal beta barrel domain-containing protein [Sulfitobacter sp. D35]MDW4500470.1 MOSC domain-containing protein [Sulfitobacter sp. D35]
MTAVTHLWRHPLKSHGREAVTQVVLRAGEAMPWDRVWAVAHEASRADAGTWSPCANFSRVAKAPSLMAITARLDETTERITLSHPRLPDLAFNPDTEADAFIQWVSPIVPQDRAMPQRILRLDGRGYTDSDFASITLCNIASHRAVEAHMDRQLSIHRWRGNIWFEHLEPWAEFNWIGREITIGGARLRVRERTDRCMATAANPDTGQRDADTLKALDHWGHRDFSVRAEVIEGGPVSVGDAVEVH